MERNSEVLRVSLCFTVPVLSRFTRSRKLARFDGVAEHFGRKVCESQQYAPLPALSAVVCVCRTASVRRKGEKTQRLGTLVKNQLRDTAIS
ncbi:uncharacterized [Tachysurus ichikawai]